MATRTTRTQVRINAKNAERLLGVNLAALGVCYCAVAHTGWVELNARLMPVVMVPVQSIMIGAMPAESPR